MMGFMDKLKRTKPEGHSPLEAAQADNQIEEATEATMYDKVGDDTVELGIPQNTSTSKKSNVRKVGFLVMGLLGLGVVVASLMSFMGGGSDDSGSSETEQLDVGVKSNQYKDFNQDKEALALMAEEEAEEAMASEVDVEEETELVTDQVPAPDGSTQTTEYASSSNTQPAADVGMSPRDRKLTGDVLVSVSGSGVGGSDDGNYHMTSRDGEDNHGGERGGFAERLQPSVTASASATKRGDVSFLLRKGTNIPCTLDTQIITTHAGLTRCMVTKDVYSANGKVLLLERGSIVNGEQTTALVQGQARVFVLWNDVETPKGIKVALNSPSAGQLGASGQAAHVKYHFFRRFGGAILISLIGDFGTAYSNRQKGNGQNITFETTSEAAQDMATEALRNTINIPPTGYINQGQLLNIMVARDVDFGKVYEVVDTRLMY